MLEFVSMLLSVLCMCLNIRLNLLVVKFSVGVKLSMLLLNVWNIMLFV